MTFVHHELNTDNPAAAKKFYKGLFGWSFQDMKMPDGSVYSMFQADPTSGGGVQKNPMPGAPNAWLQYVGVKSVKQSMAKAKKLGATVLVEYMPIPEHGALGIFADPTGATCAVWEPNAKAAKKAGKKKASKKKTAKKAAGKKKAAKKAGKKTPAKPAATKAAKKSSKKKAKKRARR
ncbi:MAG TPA: VOC family protein [Polyangiaceae bacterium]|nr:VOC family protein [Polyangiaceae bacterium]HMR76530.1 VOC family protein [Polyangiaceae bacterium]